MKGRLIMIKSKRYETLRALLENSPEARLKADITTFYQKFNDDLLPITQTCYKYLQYAEIYINNQDELDQLYNHISYCNQYLTFHLTKTPSFTDIPTYSLSLSDTLSNDTDNYSYLFDIRSDNNFYRFNFSDLQCELNSGSKITPAHLYYQAYEIIHQTYNWLTDYIDTMILSKHARTMVHTPMTDNKRLSLLASMSQAFLQDKCDYLFTQYTDVLVPMASDCKDLIDLLTFHLNNPSLNKMLSRYFQFESGKTADHITIYNEARDKSAEILLYFDSKVYSLNDFHEPYSTGSIYFRASTSNKWFDEYDSCASFPNGGKSFSDIKFIFDTLIQNYNDTYSVLTNAHTRLTDYVDNEIISKLSGNPDAA